MTDTAPGSAVHRGGDRRIPSLSSQPLGATEGHCVPINPLSPGETWRSGQVSVSDLGRFLGLPTLGNKVR